MFRGARHVLFILVAILRCAHGDIVITNERRHGGAASNYQMCLDSFDVHRDKIIKTQDSRDMGAKYLSVLDVDSRLDCLKYCCETERCDVFIFEEKKPGSCYLFQCGPLHDFKCKFTRHSNYTSAVRTSYSVPNEEIRISQQEHELKSLRKNSEITADYGFTEALIKPVQVTQIPKTAPTTLPPAKPACSRNQYECRSSGDCIAIYNVCDGIPQCADGSDEAADLVCPTEKPTVPPPILPPMMQTSRPSTDVLRYQQILEQRKPLPPFYPAAPEINPKTWEIPNLARQMPQNILYPSQPVELQAQMRKNSYGSPGYQWDYQQLYEQNKDPYVPVNAFHEQNVNPYEQPRIFNHKGSSVIENNEADRALYMDSKRPYASHFPSSNKIAWQQETLVQLPPSSIRLDSQQKDVSNVGNPAKITTTPACDTPEEHNKNELTHDAEPIEKNDKTDAHLAYAKMSKQTTEKPISSVNNVARHNQVEESKDHKSVIVIEEHGRAHERPDVIAERLQIIENDVLRPKGAVVSLSLGLVATAIMAALIVCRLRVVKRRGRCGHGPYAHDADYLVNGMYL